MFKIIEEKGSRYVVRDDRTVEGLTKGVKKISLKKSDAEPVERLLEVPFCDNDELARHIAEQWEYARVDSDRERLLEDIMVWLQPDWAEKTEDEILYLARGYDSDSDVEPEGDDGSLSDSDEGADEEEVDEQREFLLGIVERVNEGNRFVNVLQDFIANKEIPKNAWATCNIQNGEKHGLGKQSQGVAHIYKHTPELHLQHLSATDSELAKRELKMIQDADHLDVRFDGKLVAIIDGRSEVIETNFMVASFRGVHYLSDRWSRPAREAHYGYDERSLLYAAESLLKMLDRDVADRGCDEMPLFYLNFHHMLDDFMNNESARRQSLQANAMVLQENIVKFLRSSFYVVMHRGADKYNIFDNELYFFNYVYSNGIAQFLKLLGAAETRYSEKFKLLLDNAFNFFVSVSELPYHAACYSLGSLKNPYKRWALSEKYIEGNDAAYKGRVFIPHVGKVVAGLHPLQELTQESSPDNVRVLSKQRALTIDMTVAPEQELSFLGSLEAERLFMQTGIKQPSFHRGYKDCYLEKYGLTSEMYELFHSAFAEQPADNIRTVFARQTADNDLKQPYVVLREYLCQFHAAKLHAQVLQEVRNISVDGSPAVLVYYDPQKKFTIDCLPKTTKGTTDGLSETDRNRFGKMVFAAGSEQIAQEYECDDVDVYNGALRARLVSPANFRSILEANGVENVDDVVSKVESPATPLSAQRSERTSPDVCGDLQYRGSGLFANNGALSVSEDSDNSSDFGLQ